MVCFFGYYMQDNLILAVHLDEQDSKRIFAPKIDEVLFPIESGPLCCQYKASKAANICLQMFF